MRKYRAKSSRSTPSHASVANIQTLCDQALAFEEQGQLVQALQKIEQAHRLLPDHLDIAANRVRYLAMLDRVEEAAILLDALPDEPSHHRVQAMNALAVQYDQHGERQRARSLLDRAIHIEPAYAELWNNKALVLLHNNELDAAVQCIRRALDLDADQAEFYHNASQILGFIPRWHEARLMSTQALARNPEHSGYWFQLYRCCYETRDYHYARTSLEQSIKYAASEKNLEESKALLLNLDLYLTRWDHYVERCLSIQQAIDRGEVPVLPFVLLSLPLPLSAHRQMIPRYVQRELSPIHTAPFVYKKQPGSRIRIAYISSDLGSSHPVMHLCRGLLTRHDRSQFEVFIYATASHQDFNTNPYLAEHAEHFVDVSSLSFLQMLERIRSDAPSIAVDLNGHTGMRRMDLYSERVAPIQINYIGFPGTTGSEFHEYIFADEIVIPEQHEAFYTEKIARLPGCFQVNDDARVKAQLMSRQEAGLPEGVQVLASFNNTPKINPLIFSCWMQVMRQLPSSVLWLIANTDDVMAQIRAHAAERGVDGNRIFFAQHVRYDQHLSRLTCVDLVLDTLPFGGGASTSDALWSGVPVLTCLGDTFAGRMSASLLLTAGLPELVTYSLESYQERAVALLHQPEQLLALRQRLMQPEVQKRIFDTSRQVQSIEAAYRHMLVRYEQNLPPATFSVLEDGTIQEQR